MFVPAGRRGSRYDPGPGPPFPKFTQTFQSEFVATASDSLQVKIFIFLTSCWAISISNSSSKVSTTCKTRCWLKYLTNCSKWRLSNKRGLAADVCQQWMCWFSHGRYWLSHGRSTVTVTVTVSRPAAAARALVSRARRLCGLKPASRWKRFPFYQLLVVR